MSNVFANNLEISGKAVNAQTIAAFPDVCFTPPQTPATPPGVPIPYPSFGMASDTENGTGTVKIGGETVNIKNKSDEKRTSGTEAGCAPKKGIITSQNTGKKYFHKWSPDVKFEGEPVIRFSDLATHNHASPQGQTPLGPRSANFRPTGWIVLPFSLSSKSIRTAMRIALVDMNPNISFKTNICSGNAASRPRHNSRIIRPTGRPVFAWHHTPRVQVAAFAERALAAKQDHRTT
ncbi:DUF4150 domain-containing protein [Rhizobium beringeri]